MVEGQRHVYLFRVDKADAAGVVGRSGDTDGPGDEHGRHGMQAGVAPWVGVGVELAGELDLERSLLSGFTNGGGLQALSVIDEAAGQGPAEGRVLSLYEDDLRPAPAPAGSHLDDQVDRGHGVAGLLEDGHIRAETFYVRPPEQSTPSLLFVNAT